MSKPIVFYFVIAILFLAINGGAYFVLFAPALGQYQEQEDALQSKRVQRKSIQSKQEEIQKYREIEPTYAANNDFYKKWVRKNFSSAEIKVYLHELGNKLNLKIEPEDKNEGQILDGLQPARRAELPENIFASYEINAFFLPEQLKEYLNALMSNKEKLFLVRTLEVVAISIDEPRLAGFKVSEKDKFLRVKLILDYVYFLPTEEAPKEE